MAQDFVGSNNINLLTPSGQFGTRLSGGDDAASPRYIFTHLSPIARHLFPESDDSLLTYREDDGQVIEPVFYCPVIPLLLINGNQGIGTGWSTFIPPYNPLDILNYVLAKLNDESTLPPIRPFAKGFSGEIVENPKGGFVTIGRATILNDRTVLIDELPLKCWTNTYKELLVKMRDNGSISNFIENHTTTKVSFTLTFKGLQLNRLDRGDLETSLKLKSNLLTSNMHAFDSNGILRKYEMPEDIISDFFPVRMKLYEDRKSVLESEMGYNAALLRNKARFIQNVSDGEMDLLSGRKSKLETTESLKEMEFSTSSDLLSIRNDNEPYRRRRPALDAVVDIDEEDGGGVLGEFDYLLNMPISSLTKEKIASLQEEALKNERDLAVTKATSAADLWRIDLKALAKLLKQ